MMMKNSKKIAAMALGAALITPAIVSPIPTFAEDDVANATNLSDIKGHWSEQIVKDAIALGYVNGYQDGTFKPDKSVSYAEFITMLIRALHSSDEIEKVQGNDWYKPYLDKAIKKGYVLDKEFANLNGMMNRADLAKLAVRGLKINNYYGERKYLYLAVSNGLIVGVDNKGTLNETGNMTRAQAVTVINRILQIKGGEKLTVDKRALSQAEVYYHRTNMFTMFSHVLDARQVDKIQDNDVFKRSYYNGAYSDETLGIYVIDLADANDPYRYLINGGVYGPNSDSILNAKEGYAVVHVVKMSVTSNPANLEMYTHGSTYLKIGNGTGSMAIRFEQPGSSMNLSVDLNTTRQTKASTFIPLASVQKPESIAIYTTDAWQFGGGTSKQHYLQYTE